MKLVIYDLDDTLFDTTGQLYNGNRRIETISLFKGVIELLDRENVINVLVTAGDMEIQYRKIGALKIKDYFDRIVISNSNDLKLRAFDKIVVEWQHMVKEIIVVGNRIDCEIHYGNMLGLRTVHLPHGKHKNLVPQCGYQVPKHTISTIDEFEQFLD